MQRLSSWAAGSLLVAGLFLSVFPLAAEPRTTSDLLLPYFEVDLEGPQSTLFAVGNSHEGPVDVRVSVATDWGIRVLGVTLRLEGGEVATVNLKDWLVDGNIPTGQLGPDMLAHVQAALTGQPSPKDGLYYGSAPETPGMASGFVTLRVQGTNGDRPDSLWGDYFMVGGAGLSMGELLVDIDTLNDCRSLCDRHLVRFLDGGAFEDGTELVVWTGRTGAPSPTPQPEYVRAEISGGAFYDESGSHLTDRFLDLMPTQTISVGDLDLPADFGWIDIVTEDPVYVGVLYRAGDEFSVAIQSWCAEEPTPKPPQGSPGPPPGPEPAPAIHLEKHTAGADADLPPGPALVVGSEILWQYHVTNTGNVRLTDIAVTDDQGVAVTCPRTTLGVGASMTCTGEGVATIGQYANIGTASGRGPGAVTVTDTDPSHYLGIEIAEPGVPAVVVQKLTNGYDADTAPGPSIAVGDPVTWTYVVTNVGDVDLTGVAVADSDAGVTVTCPGDELAVGASMTCVAGGFVSSEGQYQNVGTVTAAGDGQNVSATDPSHYFGVPGGGIVGGDPAVSIEKLTNGYDADGVSSAPHLVHGDPVSWTYVVTNTGGTPLSNIVVTDDRGVAVSCPGDALDPGESMTCTGSGTAVAGDACYCNVGLVIASPPEGGAVTDSDPSHYCAEEVPGVAAIDVEKSTNGEDADVAPGPSLFEGDNVQWSYVVTNTGDVTLTGVTVTDDQGVTVTCPGGQPFELAPGESKTCLGNGTAILGQYANLATATGTPEGGGDDVTATDPSHYLGEEVPADGEGTQGCTPGYWKQSHHFDSWAATGYSPGQTVESVFTEVGTWPAIGDATLEAALSFSGGPGLEAKAALLVHHAVAALLNASNPDVDYPRTAAEVIADTNAALASGDQATIEALKDAFDADNNLGCPLN